MRIHTAPQHISMLTNEACAVNSSRKGATPRHTHGSADGDGHQQPGAFTSGLNTNFLSEFSGATVSSRFHFSGSRARKIFTNFPGHTGKIN